MTTALPRLKDLQRSPRPRGRVGSKPRGEMNRTEQRYSEHLEDRRRVGQIAGYWFEAFKFRLADRTWYAPDFMVMTPDGSLEIHEVKGHTEDDGAVKLKVTAALYWAFPIFVVRHDRMLGFTLTELKSHLSR